MDFSIVARRCGAGLSAHHADDSSPTAPAQGRRYSIIAKPENVLRYGEVLDD
jgi:hypothetical protein